MKIGKWVLWGGVLLLFIGIILFIVVTHLIKTHPGVARKVNSSLPIRTATAQLTTVRATIGANGEVQPIELVNLTALVSSRIEKSYVDIGDIVYPGKILISFDQELLKATLRTAKLELEQGEKQVKFAQEEYEHIKNIYEKGLSNAILKSAQSYHNKATGELERAVQNLKRIKAIYDQKLLSKIELEKATADMERAMAEYDKSEEMLLITKKDILNDLEKARDQQIIADTEYSKLEEKYIRAKKDLNNSTITSTVSGIILERMINIGETPNLGQKLITIGRVDNCLFEARVSEDKLDDIQLFQHASITFNAFPNYVINGKVVKIKPVSDPETRSFMVYVKIPNPDLKLKPGLTGFVRFSNEKQTLAIPSIAIINPTGLQDGSVFIVQKDSSVKLKSIQIGSSAEGMTEVIEGLSNGDQVVVAGQINLKDGDLIRVGDEFNAANPKIDKDGIKR